MKHILIKIVKLYQVTPFNTHNKCRYIPTCSNYCIQALEEYGTIKGIYLTIKRIIRCRPAKEFAIDLLPSKEEKCEKVS